MQIKEARLAAGGAIDNGTLSWVSLPQINVNGWIDVPKYHKLNYESRAIDLDDLIAPPKFLVTGVNYIANDSGYDCIIYRLQLL